MALKLSINILTWNNWKTLHETLHVLAEDLQFVDYEIIIVDNGSTDECKNVATIRNSVNLGISKGKNQGIEASTGEFVFLLDGDIVPVPNSILCLLDHMEQNPECLAIGFYPNKFSTQKNKGEELDRNHEEHHEWRCHKLYDIKEHHGHCIYYGIYHRSVFDRGLRLDEEYDKVCFRNGVFNGGYGWEDLDTHEQMKALGIKQYVAHINHAGGKYYHNINSSIRNMGYPEYIRTSLKRSQYFKSKWPKVRVA